MKNNKTFMFFRFFLFFAGFLFLVCGTFICINTFDYSDTANTVGIIDDIKPYSEADGDVHYKTYVKYTVGQKLIFQF